MKKFLQFLVFVPWILAPIACSQGGETMAVIPTETGTDSGSQAEAPPAQDPQDEPANDGGSNIPDLHATSDHPQVESVHDHPIPQVANQYQEYHDVNHAQAYADDDE